MSKSLRFAFMVTGGALTMILFYLFVTKSLDVAGREVWFKHVTRNLVRNQSHIKNSDHFYLGLYRPELPLSFDKLYEIEDSLGAAVSIVSFYQAWGSAHENRFPLDICRTLDKGGFIPMITWEPWVVAFDGYANRAPDSSLALITTGTFDSYIRQYARDIVLFKKPLLIRPGHEMSNGWYAWSTAHKNSPEMFKQFWIHVHTIFMEEGAHNASFVWNPYQVADTVAYPGDRYVDWVGLDIFNFGNYAVDGTWLDFYTITKLFYDHIKRYDKPIILAEVGTVSSGGNKAQWYRDMFHVLAKNNFPLVKAAVLFDTPNSQTPTGMKVDLGMSTEPDVYSIINKHELVDSLKIEHVSK